MILHQLLDDADRLREVAGLSGNVGAPTMDFGRRLGGEPFLGDLIGEIVTVEGHQLVEPEEESRLLFETAFDSPCEQRVPRVRISVEREERGAADLELKCLWKP